MNAVEIEEAVSELARGPFDAHEFPFAFLAAFGNKEATIKRLRAGNTNKSDLGGVLQRNQIHVAVAAPGETVETLARLRTSPQTERQKAKFILATDGEQVEAEEIGSGDVLSCRFADLGNNFGFFLPLAGISTVKEVKNNPIDIKATGRLNRLYVQLLKENPDWGTAAKRADLNRFMARLIFCFFAEDTGIFNGDGLFTATIQQMSEADGSNTHEVINELFRAMNLDPRKGERVGIRPWADVFPYVNGGLFENDIGCPRFSRTSRAYLLRAGELDWKAINPDIFGSMIQAVADEDERGELGMHYTSVPNIQKVLDPLFLDDLREQLEEAGTNKRKLYNLRQRLSRIRVFDPACGSGNFLVIAYIRMREIEDEVMRRRGERLERSAIRLTQFYGIEIKSFAAEIARLSLLIAEFQCDVRFIGQAEARALVLPLHATGNILTGNALRLDWEEVCPPAKASLAEHDLAGPTGRLALDGADEEWETYICGNPPYLGRKYQSDEHKRDLRLVSSGRIRDTLSLDYVAGWFVKAADYIATNHSKSSFVSTNSVSQGIQVSSLWPALFDIGVRIYFAYTSFKWSNLASHNAGVTVVIVGLRRRDGARAKLYQVDPVDGLIIRTVDNVSPYLVAGPDIFVRQARRVPDERTPMQFGNHPYYANALMLSYSEGRELSRLEPEMATFIRPLYGSKELISGHPRSCIWITSKTLPAAKRFPEFCRRIERVRSERIGKKKDIQAQKLVEFPYRFRDQAEAKHRLLVIPIVSSENRPYLPIDLLNCDAIVHNKAFAMYDASLWNLSLFASRLHLIWIGTVCVRLRTDFSYSNTLGWNTFPVPKLTDQNKADLTRCAEDILLAREAHFPATIAELYEPEAMPADLRAAHDRNDETLERIYIGRRFRNDTERLEKLFEMYARMTAKKEAA